MSKPEPKDEREAPVPPTDDDRARKKGGQDRDPSGPPFFPSERQLCRILFGQDVPRDAADIIRQLERDGLPRPQRLTGRRYLPAVVTWLREREAGDGRPSPRVVRPRDVPGDGPERF